MLGWLLVLGACAGTSHPPVAPAPPAGSPEPAASAKAPEPAPAPASVPPADALATYQDALLHGHPAPATFQALHDLFPSLTPAQRAAVRALGSSKAAPIHVPSIRFEYVWVQDFACEQGAGKVGMQALIGAPGGGQLDELSFQCPGSTDEHRAYFDFSDDPAEKAMRQELGGH